MKRLVHVQQRRPDSSIDSLKQSGVHAILQTRSLERHRCSNNGRAVRRLSKPIHSMSVCRSVASLTIQRHHQRLGMNDWIPWRPQSSLTMSNAS